MPLIGVAASVYFGFALLASTIHTPLLVAQSRLAVQRTRSFGEGEEAGLREAEVAAAAGVERFSSEDVITLRDEEVPYTGFVDCLNKMTAEEGWRTLFRAWWVTFLGFYFVAAL
ncbi:hypothetical protein AAF712_008848 [Marasmius tenuissimus]|uniref:Uncharacterized protein n=1 Tax=Marasmius tenuissimus TaxID=585030 RepID=A0ABR2ZU24_9AGAR